MDQDDTKLSNTWRVDDLDAGLADGISNIQGLGNQHELLKTGHTPAYDMTEVLQLQLFKEEMLDGNDLLQSLNESLNTRDTYIHGSLEASIGTLQHLDQSSQITSFSPDQYLFSSKDIKTDDANQNYNIILKAPTAPGRKLAEETLTWLNQGQSYEIVLEIADRGTPTKIPEKVKGVVSIGFQQRQHQYFEHEKYDEWVLTRPNERMIELDFPMCFNILESSHIGSYTNEIEFLWDPSKKAGLFLKVNCLSSEFTKGKGESGVPLRLLIEIFNSVDSSATGKPDCAVGCQVKVFRAKGANRKLKLEREKHESLSKEVANQVQQSNDVTMFKKVECVDRSRRRSAEVTCVQVSNEYSPMCGNSPTPLRIVNGTNTSMSSPDLSSSYIVSSPNEITTNLTANSNVEETQRWLTYHRFENYANCFANFTGVDLLRMSRNDLIQLCGPADGIRLNNALQARASRPLLTMYISPEWHQSGTGMREYHAMFLEQLNVEDLKRKLAKKCGIQEETIIGILKQGPTGIHIHIDDDVVRNFVDEAHHVVEVLKDLNTGHSRIILK